MELQPGASLQGGKYKIQSILGQGGFGITYLATTKLLLQGTLGKIEGEIRVTIKEFFMKELCCRNATTLHVSVPSTGSLDLVNRFRAKFFKEANNIATLQHPNIVKVIDVFEENGTAYYVMEYVEGGSLQDWVKQHGALPENEALNYIRQIASALNYIHLRKMNHLDVKPANILRKSDGRIVLIDFGLSKQYDEKGDQTSSTPVGVSTGYAPVEQSKPGGVGQFSAPTDIYSVGATLYKLVTGITPPDALDIINDGIPPLPGHLNPSTIKAIQESMKPSKRNRPQSIKEFMALLNGEMNVNADEETKIDPVIPVIPDRESIPSPTPVPPPTSKLASKHINLLLVILLLGIPFLIFLLINKSNDITDSYDFEAFQDSIRISDSIAAVEAAIEEAVFMDAADSMAVESDSVAGAEVVQIEKFARTPPVDITKNVDVKSSTKNKQITVNGVSFDMIYVEGGDFRMGSNEGGKDEAPVHTVTLSSYYIGKTEVTQALWKAVMGNNPSEFKGDDLPVENVNWNDCQSFIKKLNNLSGRSFRLPTEAEWEYAARGGSKKESFHYSGSNDLKQVAWYEKNSKGRTHSVGMLAPNGLGIYDMSGNIFEWCSDRFGNYTFSKQIDPVGAASGSRRVLRGGCWDSSANVCTVSCRHNVSPDDSYSTFGLRLVCSSSSK